MAFDPIESGARDLAQIARGYLAEGYVIARLQGHADFGFREQRFSCVNAQGVKKSFFPADADMDAIEDLLGKIYEASRDQDRGAGVIIKIETSASGDVDFSIEFPTKEEAYGSNS